MTAQHTPGPWHYRPCGSYGLFTVLADEPNTVNRVIADVADKGADHVGEAKANARLIAAAPELLAVLEAMFVDGGVQVMFAGNPNACEALEKQALAAIAKAKGEP